MAKAPSMSELNAIHHAMANLAKNFQQLLHESRALLGLDLDNFTSDDDMLVEKLVHPRIRLAQKMVRAYNQGEFPVVDEILSPGDLSGSVQLFSGSPAASSSSSSSSSFKGSAKSSAKDSSSKDTEDSKGGKKKWPPELPLIRSKRLLNQALTHKSVVNRRQYLTKEEKLHDHNERLEFLGDAVLNFHMSQLVYNRFPNLPEGDMTSIRAMLVCNDTLWEWASMYGLDKRLQKEFEIDTTGGKKSKLIADTMEAYIGAVCLDTPEGPQIAREWLIELVEPLVQRLVKEYKSVEPLNKDAKNELYVKIGSMDCKPEYVTTEEGDNLNPFTVEVRVNGDVLGVGTGPNTKEAGLRAAMEALSKRDAIERYAEVRRSKARTANQTGGLLEPIPKKRKRTN
ncbi:ribonuclease 3 [Trichomonascus vanleenenianus]|uniref:ribonuclease III n=1 Tax=Trichomonascus vanleenenianus TaxID=2268995 RepID=UPI003EC9AB12